MDGYDELREPHYLRQNIRAGSPQQLVFVDTEAKQEVHPLKPKTLVQRFRLGVARRCRLSGMKPTRCEELRFTEPSVFWDWLYQCMAWKGATWLFAHNLGYDWTMLGGWEQMEINQLRLSDDGWPIRGLKNPTRKGERQWRGLLVAEDPPSIFSVRHLKYTLKAVDTRNYFPESAKRIGEFVGLPKGELPPWEASDEVWFDYCRRDVEIIERLMLQLIAWWKQQDLGLFRFTAAGLAWNAFRHRFLEAKRILIHGHTRALKLERESYFGGENRCFYIGNVEPAESMPWASPMKSRSRLRPVEIGPVYELDHPSFYASVMRGRLYPVKLIDYMPKLTLSELPYLDADVGAIAHVTVKTETTCYPKRFKPVEPGEEDGLAVESLIPKRLGYYSVRYCLGQFDTFLCGPELEAAQQAGHIIAVHSAAFYALAEIFTDYVDLFWSYRSQAKEKGDKVTYNFFKMLLRALSGKFAQKAGNWLDEPETPAIRPWHHWYQSIDGHKIPQLYRSIGLHSQRYLHDGEAPDSFPAVSAWITAYGRERMRELRRLAGPRQTLYQDTDSLHVLRDGYAALVAAGQVGQDELGKVNLKQIADSACYYGLKHYRIGIEEKCGSIRGRREQITETKYRQLDFQRLPGILAFRPNGTIEIVTRDIEISLCHPDGHPDTDGWVNPITLPRDVESDGAVSLFQPSFTYH